MKLAQEDLNKYLMQLHVRSQLLTELIDKYNDGRSLSYFCTAVNNLELDDLLEIERNINRDSNIKSVKERFSQMAQQRNIIIRLRK